MDHDRHEALPFWRSPAGLTLLVALAAVGFYLVTEHTAHLLGVLPYLFVLACPLMHVFMNRGHGHGGNGHGQPRSGDENRRTLCRLPPTATTTITGTAVM